MKNKEIVILNKVIKYCLDIEYLMKKYEYDFEKYQNDISFQYACNMCIIQIGELVGRLPDNFMGEHKNIPWHAIKSMRNLHAHDYENVDLEIVWNTLIEDIPFLKKQLEDIVNAQNGAGEWYIKKIIL